MNRCQNRAPVLLPNDWETSGSPLSIGWLPVSYRESETLIGPCGMAFVQLRSEERESARGVATLLIGHMVKGNSRDVTQSAVRAAAAL